MGRTDAYGAIAGLVSSPEGIGREGGELARQWNPVKGALPGARYASGYEMVFNQQVARSLEILLPTEQVDLAKWHERLK